MIQTKEAEDWGCSVLACILMFQGWGWKGGRRRCLWGSPGRGWHLSPKGRSDSFTPGKPDLTLQYCLTTTGNHRRNRKHKRNALFSKTFTRWRVHGSSESSFDHHARTCSVTWPRNPGHWEFETLKTVSCQISKLEGGVDINDKNNSEKNISVQGVCLEDKSLQF